MKHLITSKPGSYGIGEKFVIGDNELLVFSSGGVNSVYNYRDLLGSLYDLHQTSETTKTGDTFQVNGIVFARVEGVHVIATLDGEQLLEEEAAKFKAEILDKESRLTLADLDKLTPENLLRLHGQLEYTRDNNLAHYEQLIGGQKQGYREFY